MALQNLLRNRMPSASPARIAGIYRYPVKGLTPEPLPRVALKAGQTLPSDRRYAIENGPSGFDPAAPKWLPKAHFLMLMRDEWLAPLRTQFDDESHVLTIRDNGEIVAQGDLETAEGRAAIEHFLRVARRPRSRARQNCWRAPATAFRTSRERSCRSSISTASAPSRPWSGSRFIRLRFRANFYVEGWPAWREFDLARPDADDRRRPGPGREADHPLRRRQCRPRQRRARSHDPAGLDAEGSATMNAASTPR